MTQGFEPLDELSSRSDRVELVEVIAPQFYVGGVGPEYLKSNHQQFVAGGDNRFGPPSSGFDALKERAQVSLLAVGNRPSCLSQNAP